MSLLLRCTCCGRRFAPPQLSCPACGHAIGVPRQASLPLAALLGASVLGGCVEPRQPRPANPVETLQTGCGGDYQFEDSPLCAGGVYGAPFGTDSPGTGSPPPRPPESAPDGGVAPDEGPAGE